MNTKAIEARARRAARREGLIARKSRARLGPDNYGGFMLIDPYTGAPQAGFWYDMSAEEVIEFCKANLTPDIHYRECSATPVIEEQIDAQH